MATAFLRSKFAFQYSKCYNKQHLENSRISTVPFRIAIAGTTLLTGLLATDVFAADNAPSSEPQKKSSNKSEKRAIHTKDKPADHVTVLGHLDQARGRIFPSLGAVSYGIDQRQIQATPQGQNASFSQIMLRMPGVVQDSYGEVHV
mgnify:FL=1